MTFFDITSGSIELVKKINYNLNKMGIRIRINKKIFENLYLKFLSIINYKKILFLKPSIFF